MVDLMSLMVSQTILIIYLFIDTCLITRVKSIKSVDVVIEENLS